MRERVLTAIPFGVGTVVYVVAGVAAWSDAADYVPVGDGMTDGVNTLGFEAGAMSILLGVLMLALGVRQIASKAALRWIDRATTVGALAWTAGFLPYLYVSDAPPAGSTPHSPAHILALRAVSLWFCGGACLVVATIYVVSRCNAQPPIGGFNRRVKRFESRADFWIVWLPAVLSFAGATILFWRSGVKASR